MTHLLPVHWWNFVLMAGVRTCMLFSRLLASVSRVNHPGYCNAGTPKRTQRKMATGGLRRSMRIN